MNEPAAHPVYADFLKSFRFTGRLDEDVTRLLNANGCPKTAEHCLQVGAEAARIARRFGVDEQAAEVAGYLHDISAVFPNSERIRAARELGIEVLPEEEAFPMIIHQKISKAMAEHLFQIRDEAVLDAIGCHTTLRAGAAMTDLVLFVADKIVWDQQGKPPYLDRLTERLELSLQQGALAYIEYLWEYRDKLKVVHPWLADAYNELKVLYP
jgi:predicted HD superfamily hydrolase involved in NAD metabolism